MRAEEDEKVKKLTIPFPVNNFARMAYKKQGKKQNETPEERFIRTFLENKCDFFRKKEEESRIELSYKNDRFQSLIDANLDYRKKKKTELFSIWKDIFNEILKDSYQRLDPRILKDTAFDGFCEVIFDNQSLPTLNTEIAKYNAKF